MSPCLACRRGTAIPPGQPIPPGWRAVALIERQSGPAVGVYACPVCIEGIARLAEAATRLEGRTIG